MYDYLAAHQLNLMMWLCGICGIIAVLLLFSNALTRKRKWILILMELTSMSLLMFDRSAYIYAGNTDTLAYYMVRISNFLVFFLTPMVVLAFNIYISDLLVNEGGEKNLPIRIVTVNYATIIGMVLVAVYHFNGFYYYFDENNYYHRGPGFVFCYAVPVICTIVQYTVVREYKKQFSKAIYLSLVHYIILPIFAGIVQMIMAGISIANMAIAVASVLLYIFTYIDINDKVEKTYTDELAGLIKDNRATKKFFDQLSLAVIGTIDSRDPFTKGRSERVADYSRKIAELSGKDEKECDEIYYCALYHNIGTLNIPESVLQKRGKLTEEELAILNRVSAAGNEILSSVTEDPKLADAAKYAHEKYDGSGIPEGLSGDEIPEVARIIAVADSYVELTSVTRDHNPIPSQIVREEFIKNAGTVYDPEFAGHMVHIMDIETDTGVRKDNTVKNELEKSLNCGKYRDAFTSGIRIRDNKIKITFESERETGVEGFSAPSLILFDSFDRLVHDNAKAIEDYHYLEYGELWFDDHFILTGARAMKKTAEKPSVSSADDKDRYTVIALKYEDHVKIITESAKGIYEYTIVLPDNSKAFYISITGENCRISRIEATEAEEITGPDDIERIEDVINYAERIESDIPNVQIDRPLSAATIGVKLSDKKAVRFHSMSLPAADLVWHCPYICIFSSEDGLMNGPGYTEFAMIKLNGEYNDEGNAAENRFNMKRTYAFPGWDKWKEKNKRGVEYEVSFAKRGKQIILSSDNLGIVIENITTLPESAGDVYFAITGDQVAITDIRLE